MDKETLFRLLLDARSALTRIINALDEIDKTDFGDLSKHFDTMARDAADADKALDALEKEVG
jgi:hypothetical protein